MPNWIKRSIYCSLVCALCGSLVIQSLGIWLCLNNNCEKHDDEPIRQNVPTTINTTSNSLASGTNNTSTTTT